MYIVPTCIHTQRHRHNNSKTILIIMIQKKIVQWSLLLQLIEYKLLHFFSLPLTLCRSLSILLSFPFATGFVPMVPLFHFLPLFLFLHPLFTADLPFLSFSRFLPFHPLFLYFGTLIYIPRQVEEPPHFENHIDNEKAK